MIKAIIFDVGGTYMKGSFIDFMNRAYQILGVDKIFTAKDEIIFDSDYNKGKISVEECFRKIFGKHLNDSQIKQIAGIWTTTWAPTKAMQELVKKLHKNYRLAILSNSDQLNSNNYQKRGWYDFFNPVILSHEIGLLKPDPKIYELTLHQLQLDPKQCLFIDDQPKVLAPAKKMGLSTIHFQSLRQLKKELKSRGIKY